MHPGEDVEPAGRALRVGLGAHVLGQRQLLDQRHQVGAVALEHGAVAQVDFLEGEPLDLLLDGRVDVGQEGAAQRPGEVAEAQVDAGRLDRLGADPVVAGADPLGLDRLAQRLRGEDARAGARCCPPLRSPRSSSRDYSPRLVGAEVGRQRELEHLRQQLVELARPRRPAPAAPSSEAMPPTTASSVAPAPPRPRGAGRALAQVGDEALDRRLVAVVDAAAGAQALDQGDAGQRRVARRAASSSEASASRTRGGHRRRVRRAGGRAPARGSARSPSRRRRRSSHPYSRNACRSHSWRPPPAGRSMTQWFFDNPPRRALRSARRSASRADSALRTRGKDRGVRGVVAPSRH